MYYNMYKPLKESNNLPGREVAQEYYIVERTLSGLEYKINEKNGLIKNIELEKNGLPGVNFIPTIGYVPKEADILKLESIFADEIKKINTLDSLTSLVQKRMKEIEKDPNYQEYRKVVRNAMRMPLARTIPMAIIASLGLYLCDRKCKKDRAKEYQLAGIISKDKP